jgi:long-chain acyl-CoA synthetase
MVPLLLEKIYRKRIKPLIHKPIVQAVLKVPPFGNLLLKKIRKNLMESFGGNFHEIIIGGAALDPEVETFLKKIRFPFTIGYGMTECGPLISYAPWNEHRPASVGKPVNYLDVKIDSEDPQCVVGNILVRGENVMIGYYKNPEATQEVLTDDGWLNTGDLGTVDQEGVIYIKGRSKNLLLGPSGQNIYPEEIEMQFNNLPFVQEALVLQENGRLFALVYPDLEAADAKGFGENALRERMEENRKTLNSRLPAYSAISRVGLYPKEFEKTPTRKIKRFLYNMSHLEA